MTRRRGEVRAPGGRNTTHPATIPADDGASERSHARTDPETPVRRLCELGPSALAVRELLAILLGSGRGEGGAEQIAAPLLARYLASDGSVRLRAIGASSVAEIARAAGISKATAARVVAALELGRRAASEALPVRLRVDDARAVWELMRLPLRDLAQEEFHVLLLDGQKHLIRSVQVSRGTLDRSVVHPREVFRPAIEESAAAVVLVHNHPSGDPEPSREDWLVTHQIVQAGAMIGIIVLDHVIIGEGRHYSFAAAGTLE